MKWKNKIKNQVHTNLISNKNQRRSPKRRRKRNNKSIILTSYIPYKDWSINKT